MFSSSLQLQPNAKCQPYYKLLKISVCNGSADTALNIGMNSTTIIMQGQTGKKNTWLLNPGKSGSH